MEEDITPETAKAVLHHFGHYLGEHPGGFIVYLLHAIAHADDENRERLQKVYPQLVRAVQLGRRIEGLNSLAAIVHAERDLEAVV